MTSKALVVSVGLWLAFSSARPTAQQPAALTIVQSGPTNEIASLREANDIRIVFSEPMVVLGRIPDPVTAPFVTIRPALAGTFRWSGTTILIFTPGRPNALPFATTFRVTIDASAAALSGRRVGAPYTFSFTTPTVRLLSTDWYRKTGSFDGAAIVAMRFNQPVRPADVAAHTMFRFEKHAWTPPALSPAGSPPACWDLDPGRRTGV